MSKYAVWFVALTSATVAFSQLAVSAKSGMIHHAEGKVYLNSEPVKLKFGQFPEVANGMTLATENGRAEVLLNPGAFLRMDRNASFRMISNSLSDSEIQLTGGTSLVEIEELNKSRALVVRMDDAVIRPTRTGLFRFDASTHVVQVYDGKLDVTENGKKITLKKGKQLELGTLVATKFDTKQKDGLQNWSAQRAAVIARANLVAARTAVSGRTSIGSSSWAWLPSLGLYTFLPRTGYIYSPFGYSFYSPSYLIGVMYTPRQSYGYGTSSPASAWSGVGSVAPRAAGSFSNSAGAAIAGGAGVRSAAPATMAAPSATGARGRR